MDLKSIRIDAEWSILFRKIAQNFSPTKFWKVRSEQPKFREAPAETNFSLMKNPKTLLNIWLCSWIDSDTPWYRTESRRGHNVPNKQLCPTKGGEVSILVGDLPDNVSEVSDRGTRPPSKKKFEYFCFMDLYLNIFWPEWLKSCTNRKLWSQSKKSLHKKNQQKIFFWVRNIVGFIFCHGRRELSMLNHPILSVFDGEKWPKKNRWTRPHIRGKRIFTLMWGSCSTILVIIVFKNTEFWAHFFSKKWKLAHVLRQNAQS